MAVATCDKEIFDYITSIGGKAVMTSDSHERASDRCAEALLVLESKIKENYDIVVMVQGDEPMVHHDMISEALKPMIENSNILITNLLGKIISENEFKDQNCIKVVCDQSFDALYYSRNPIPFGNFDKLPVGKQVPIIPFRRNFLIKYNSLKPTPLEITESVDMLRVVEHGYKVRMVPTNYETYAVDTAEDLERVKLFMKKKS